MGSSCQSAEAKFDLARFGEGFIDEDQQRGDLLANRVPGRFSAGNDEHVTRGRAANFGRVPVAHQNVPPRIIVEPGIRMQERCDRNGRVIQPLADASQIVPHHDPVLAELNGGSDPARIRWAGEWIAPDDRMT